MIERMRADVRVVVSVAGLMMLCGAALGQDSSAASDEAAQKQAQPLDSVGGLDIPAEGDIVVSAEIRPEYITEPLFIGELPDMTKQRLLELEVRKMKQSPPTPEELKLTEVQSEGVEKLFADHRESQRVFNNETRSDVLALRRAGGLDVRADEKTAEDEDFSPMVWINPDMIEPGLTRPDRVVVPKLTEEQSAARQELRVLLLTGPINEDVQGEVMAMLDEPQRVALQETLDRLFAEKLKAQEIRERIKRTGYMEIDDLPEALREKVDAMEPRQREAFMQRYRMNIVSGGVMKMKRHRQAVRDSMQKDFRDREEQHRLKEQEREAQGDGDS
ncbi:MAG: hypothetical protein ACI89L_000579 [Phycisphaerales bacterium]|jgi:hypothetical protein